MNQSNEDRLDEILGHGGRVGVIEALRRSGDSLSPKQLLPEVSWGAYTLAGLNYHVRILEAGGIASVMSVFGATGRIEATIALNGPNAEEAVRRLDKRRREPGEF